MTHLETLKDMSANDHINVLKVMLKDYIGFPHLAEDCAALTAAIAAMEAIDHLTANAYGHHSTDIICVPTDEWKAAMKLLDADALKEPTNDN